MIGAGWETVTLDDGDIHVLPVEDLREHEAPECWCCATRDADDETIVVHRALDQREKYENGELRLQ